MPEKLPIWNAVGVEPHELLKTDGWQPGMKPSAQHMNWLFNRIYKCLEEIQTGGGTEELEQELANLQQALATHMADYVKHPGIGMTTNTGNAYAVTLDPAPVGYVNGMGLILMINADSTAAATIKVNSLGAIPIRKANGTTVTNLKAGGVYTLRYNTSSFTLQGEGGEYGTATAGDVLKGTTIGTENGVVPGTLELTGNALVTQVLAGQTFYNANAKKKETGTIPVHTGVVYPEGASQWGDGGLAVYLKNGYYHGGSGGGEIKVTKEQMQYVDGDFTPSNIRKDTSIFGVLGTLDAAAMGGANRFASGTVTSSAATLPFRLLSDASTTTNSYHASVSLDFEADFVFLWYSLGTNTGSATSSAYIKNNPWYGKSVIKTNGAQYYTNASTGSAHVFRGDSDNAYVNITGFRLPITVPNAIYNWMAIKY